MTDISKDLRSPDSIFGANNPHGEYNRYTAAADGVLAITAIVSLAMGYRKTAAGLVGGAALLTAGRFYWVKNHTDGGNSVYQPVTDKELDTAWDAANSLYIQRNGDLAEVIKELGDSVAQFAVELAIKSPSDWEKNQEDVDRFMKKSYCLALFKLKWMEDTFKTDAEKKNHIIGLEKDRWPITYFGKLYQARRSLAAYCPMRDSTEEFAKTCKRIKDNAAASRKLAGSDTGKKFYTKGTQEDGWRTMFNRVGDSVRAILKQNNRKVYSNYLRDDNTNYPLRVLDLADNDRLGYL